MSVDSPSSVVTPEQLLQLPDGNRYELVGGQLVERTMSMESAWVANRVGKFLSNFVDSTGEGDVFNSDASYQCFGEEADRVRRPDVSFIRQGRLSPEQFREGHCRIFPDLAVEVASPNDLYYDVQQKVREYLDAGVTVVWVVDPPERSVMVYRRGGPVERLQEGDQLNGDPVLPGFAVRVGDLFPKAGAV